MSHRTEARIHGHQPPLPLVETDDDTGSSTVSGPDAEWRLDEHTREVGRLGIAAARAALRSGSRTVPPARAASTHTPDGAPADHRRATGHAA